MSKGSDLDRVTAIVLQEMRRPLIILLGVNALGIAVMIMIPGVDGERMGIFHAFYFMTYTATTTGFGEIPSEFSDGQRMWATVCLYMSVIAWIYAIGTIIRLVQNPHFTLALAQNRFAKAAARIREPFFIICGFGDTGSLLARGLSDQQLNAIVIDTDIERIKALRLRDYNVPMPGLEGDASVPKNLNDAGISRPNCKGVVLLTGDEDVNLKIAVMTRLLNPSAEIVCRSTSRAHEEELRGLGSVILADPYESFARELGFALHKPPLHTLDEWLVGADVSLTSLVSYPRGTWLLCGYGQLGRWLYRSLSEWGVKVIVIDPDADATSAVDEQITGLATRANLQLAGVGEAVGVIAATNSDADNLAILLAARSINPEASLIVRQNSHENELAFNAASADLIMQPSLVTARRILLRLISPMIQDLLEHLETHPETLSAEVLPRLTDAVAGSSPALWTLHLQPGEADALAAYIDRYGSYRLADLLKDPRGRDQNPHAVALWLKRGEQSIALPKADTAIEMGDEILLCGNHAARSRIAASLGNFYSLHYLATGEEPPRGWLMGRLASRGNS